MKKHVTNGVQHEPYVLMSLHNEMNAFKMCLQCVQTTNLNVKINEHYCLIVNPQLDITRH